MYFLGSMTDLNMKVVIGGNIRRIREGLNKGKGMSIAMCCQRIGMSRAYWLEVEKGLKGASWATLERFAKALGVTVRDLLKDSDNGEKPQRRRKAS